MENLKRHFQTIYRKTSVHYIFPSVSRKNFTKNRIKIKPWEDLNSYPK